MTAQKRPSPKHLIFKNLNTEFWVFGAITRLPSSDSNRFNFTLPLASASIPAAAQTDSLHTSLNCFPVYCKYNWTPAAGGDRQTLFPDSPTDSSVWWWLVWAFLPAWMHEIKKRCNDSMWNVWTVMTFIRNRLVAFIKLKKRNLKLLKTSTGLRKIDEFLC